jgi:archaellum biogenesis protein FlaJ (TadC family)
MKKIDYRKARTISFVLILVAILFSSLLFAFNEITALFIIIVIAFVILLGCACVIMFKYYRCPHCHDLLPVRSLPRDFCPSCGKKIV